MEWQAVVASERNKALSMQSRLCPPPINLQFAGALLKIRAWIDENLVAKSPCPDISLPPQALPDRASGKR